MIKNLCAYIFCFCAAYCSAQTDPGFLWPLDTPHTLTGNYGELRPNHFHVGLDFSTGGKINYPVYAVADGYVSRIKVSSGGYGKAVYITHPGGRLSLYAHFTSYAPAIAGMVRNEQYAKQNYEVEIFPGRNEIRIKKGQLIGYSGNSGNSSGPHLHFEIRDEKTEVPLNPLEFYKIKDSIPPLISHIAFYSLADTSSPQLMKQVAVARSKRDSLYLRNDSLVLDHSALGFAFSGYDQFVRGGNPNVSYAAKLYLDERLIYSHRLQYIAFPDQRFVNEFAETVSRIKYQKCFMPTIYPKGIYENTINKGRIILTDTAWHRLRLLLSDESGNKKALQFYFKTRKLTPPALPAAKGDLTVDCGRELQAVKNGIRVSIPKGTLYYSIPLTIRNTLEQNGSFEVLPSELNLSAPAALGFKIPKRFAKHQGRMVVCNNASVYVPVLKQDSAFCQVYNFGRFRLDADTLPPKIKTQLSPQKIKKLKKIKEFSFVLNDQLSGIARYNVLVNGQWALAEYDAKNHLLTYVFDEATPKGELSFVVNAEDRVGNTAQLKYVLKR